MSELTGSSPLPGNNVYAGHIPVQYNMPPMCLLKWPHQAPLLYNPYVPVRYTILPNGMYYSPPQWIPMRPIQSEIPVVRVTVPPQMRQQQTSGGQQTENGQTPNDTLLRNNNAPRYTMNPVDNIIRIGPVTVLPPNVRLNWQGPNVLFFQNYNQIVPWQNVNIPPNELPVIVPQQQQQIQRSEGPINNKYTSTVPLHQPENNLVKHSRESIQNFNHQVVSYPQQNNFPQNLNAPIFVPHDARNDISSKQELPYDKKKYIPSKQNAPLLATPERNVYETKQQNIPKYQNIPVPEIEPQNSGNSKSIEKPIKKTQENAFSLKETPQVSNKKNDVDDNSKDTETFNKMVEEFALNVTQDTINELLKRKVSAFCGKFFQEERNIPQAIKKTTNSTMQLIPYTNKSSPTNKPSTVPSLPTEINFPPINNPSTFDFSAYKDFLDTQHYENMLQRTYQMQLEQTRVLKRTLIALDQDEQRLRQYLKKEKPLYFHLVTVANFNTQKEMKKHITRFEYKKMLYRSVLKTKETCEKIWNEQIKFLMINDIDRNKQQPENARNNRPVRPNKPKCCKQLFVS